jgi:hypothetical protein
MGEAPLGPGETAREIGEHGHHAGHGSATKHDRRISLLEAALLALVAVLAAWSGFAAAKWSTESRLTVATASTTRNQANTAELEGIDIRLGDALVFNAWLTTHALGDAEDEAIALRRFRPELRVAFDAWQATNPETNPNAPPGPQSMPEYVEPEVERAQRLKARGEELFTEGSEQGETADDYVRTTVYLASVLFLVGLSTQFPVRVARYALIATGVVILIYSLTELFRLPKPSF